MDFQTEVNEIDAVTREVKVKIPQATLDSETKQKLKKVASTAKIKGFRPGKAPQHLIESMYGAQARYEVLNDVTVKSLDKIIADNSWRVVGQPELDFSAAAKADETEAKGDFEFAAKIFLYPKPELKSYDSFAVTVEKRKIKEDDVQSVINRTLEQRAEMKPVEGRDVVQKGDVVKGQLSQKTECNHHHEEGEACDHDHHEHSHTEPVVFKVGEGRWSADLEEQVIGLKMGESKELVFKPSPEAPEDQTRHFNFELNEIMEQILPELTDELLAELKVPEVSTVAEWKSKIEKELEAEEERLCKERVHSEIIKQLSAEHDFAIPQVMIDDEIRAIVQGEYQRFGQQIKAEEIQVENFREAFEKPALERIKNGIILFSIAEKEQLLANSQDINSMFARFADDFGIAEDQVKRYLSQDGRLAKMSNDISLRKVLEFLEAKAEITYKEA